MSYILYCYRKLQRTHTQLNANPRKIDNRFLVTCDKLFLSDINEFEHRRMQADLIVLTNLCRKQLITVVNSVRKLLK